MIRNRILSLLVCAALLACLLAGCSTSSGTDGGEAASSSSSAASSELAAKALHQLPNLKGCDVHSTVLLSGVDTGTLNRLGMYLTCDPVYEEEDRKYHKQ